MSQSNQPSFNSNSEADEKEEKNEKIKVRVSIFFDGTLNNRINIDQRMDDEDEETPENEAYQKYKGKDNSYEGDYTNVAQMEKYIYDAEGYKITLSVYTEGPGTEDKKDDSLFGYALGVWGTGIRKKVAKGIEESVKTISESAPDKKIIIELLTIDVFGFSRGAACARNCIHEVLANGKKPIKERLVEKGYKVNKVEVCFAGLYDTVSSHGLVFSNDVGPLKLAAVANAGRVVQLAAADEHRSNFSLTDIASAGKTKGLQVFLPGAHSDIGGGYRAPIAKKSCEDSMNIYQSYFERDIEKEKQRLINAGWYNDNEMKVNRRTSSSGPLDMDEYSIVVTRERIDNEYRKIPFNLMAEYAKKSGINFTSEISTEKVPATLADVNGKIREYVASAGNSSKAEDWAHNEPWLTKLRHEHLHFSAHYKFGHGPRISGGKRIRFVIRG